jgi:hypothetical protein
MKGKIRHRFATISYEVADIIQLSRGALKAPAARQFLIEIEDQLIAAIVARANEFIDEKLTERGLI